MQRLNCSATVLSLAVVVALAPLRLAAQTPAQRGDVTTSPSTQPMMQSSTQPSSGLSTQASTQPSASTTSVATHMATTFLSLNFKDASVDAVLEHLSEVAGFVVVKDQGVGSIPGRVTILSAQPVSPEEAVLLINTVLKPNGFTAVQEGRILKIEAFGKAKKGSIPVHFGADPNLIDPTDELITQVVPVRNLDVVKLKQDLAPLISPDADLSANAASNSLMITDSKADIRRIVEIVSNLDKRETSENTIEVKQLKFADATAAAKLVMDIFKTEDQQNQPQTNQMRFLAAIRGGRGGGGGQPAEDKGQTGRVLASADQRTNTVVVSGPSDTVKVIMEMLTKIDADPATEQAFFIYPVKNGQSQDMAVTLNSLFGNSTSGGSNSRTTTSLNTFGTGSTSFGGNNSSSGSRGVGSGGQAGSGSTASQAPISRTTPGAGSSGSSGSSGNTSAVAALAGQVYVVADADTNSLLVAAASKYQDRVKEIIQMLDRPVPQVLIKVLIAEVTHENSSDLGADFSVLNLSKTGRGETGVTNVGDTAVTGGLVVNIMEKDVQVTLHALATENKLDVLSRPYILASDNQLATITVGQEVPIITGSQITELGGTNNTITYTQVGITLNVTPHINPEGLVILDVAPEVSQLDTTQTVLVSPGVNAPVIDNRAADTRVGIRDGQTIVIGGMMQDQKTETIQKVPLLGDIPLVGALFQRKQVDKTKTELLIFLTPHVALEADRLREMSIDEMQGMKLTPDAVQPGTFQDQLRGMQRGGSATRPATTEPLFVPLLPPKAPTTRSLTEPPLPGTP